MAFSRIMYGYDYSDESSVVVEMTESPRMAVIVGEVMHFVDERGFVMVAPVSGEWADVPGARDVSDWSDIPADDQDDRKWAVNARWYDEGTYGVNAPDEVLRTMRRVVAALSVMYGLGTFTY